jgi:hypothetical protein
LAGDAYLDHLLGVWELHAGGSAVLEPWGVVGWVCVVLPAWLGGIWVYDPGAWGAMNLVLLLIIIIVLFGVGGGGYYGPRFGWGPSHYGGLGLVLLIIILVLLFGGGRIW